MFLNKIFLTEFADLFASILHVFVHKFWAFNLANVKNNRSESRHVWKCENRNLNILFGATNLIPLVCRTYTDGALMRKDMDTCHFHYQHTKGTYFFVVVQAGICIKGGFIFLMFFTDMLHKHFRVM